MRIGIPGVLYNSELFWPEIILLENANFYPIRCLDSFIPEALMKFLITCHYIRSFTGSEINALQIGVALRSKGHKVDIGTFVRGNPMWEMVEKTGIRVFDCLGDDFKSDHYDVIWSHHSTVLTYLLSHKKVTADKILFSSLGPTESLESPPFYFPEIHFFLVNSEENKAQLVSYGIPRTEIHYFPNYAPRHFFAAYKHEQVSSPRRIAVISNHKPVEMRDFSTLAVQYGCQVDFIGLLDQPVYVDEAVLLPYDLIVTIGKTVQYCFALKIPVYCYDYFGGPGYIDQENFERAKWANFSGRGFDRKLSGPELIEDIFANYSKATDEVDVLYEQAKTIFCLEDNLEKVLADIERMPNTDLQRIKANYSLSSRVNESYTRELKYRMLLEEELAKRENEVRLLYQDQQQKVLDIEQLSQDLQQKDRDIQQLNMDLQERDREVRKVSEDLHQGECELQKVSEDLRQRDYDIQQMLQDLQKKDNELHQVVLEVQKRDVDLAHIYNSRAWRLVRLLQNLREKLPF